MKTTLALAALALISAPALAQTDLSRPGALERLKSDKPAHYDAVLEVARITQTMTCGEQDIEEVKARFKMSKLECGFTNSSTTPPSRRVRFELEDTPYVITVRLSDTAPKLIGR